MVKRKRKNRWSSVKGTVVTVRFGELEYPMLVSRAEKRGLLAGSYLKWLFRQTIESGETLEVLEDELDEDAGWQFPAEAVLPAEAPASEGKVSYD